MRRPEFPEYEPSEEELLAATAPICDEMELLSDLVADSPEGIGLLALGAIAEHLVHEHREKAQYEYRSIHDPLTGVLSRGGFFKAAGQRLNEGLRRNQGAVVMFADIDQLKTLNDTFGHQEGDQFLREAAQALASTAGPDSLVGRYGGDEFVSLHVLDLENGADEEANKKVTGITTGLLDAVEAVIEQNPKWSSINALGVTVGNSRIYSSNFDIDEMIGQADTNMYREKPIVRRR